MPRVVADEEARRRAKRPRPTKLGDDPDLAAFVVEALRKRWSPEQIAGRLRRVGCAYASRTAAAGAER